MTDKITSIQEMESLLDQAVGDYAYVHTTKGEDAAEPFLQRLNDMIDNGAVPEALKQRTRRDIRSLGLKKEKNVMELLNEELLKPATAERETSLLLTHQDSALLVTISEKFVSSDHPDTDGLLSGIAVKLRKNSMLDATDEPSEQAATAGERDIVLTALELSVLDQLFDEVEWPDASQSKQWWHMNNLSIKIKQGISSIKSDILSELMDARRHRMKTEFGE